MNYKQLQNFLSQCKEQKTNNLYRPRAQNVEILKVTTTDELISMKSYPEGYYETQEQLSQMINTLKMQKELCHDHLTTVIDYYYGKEGLIVFTEHCSHTLFDEIEARRKQQNYFTVEQIENILISITKALKYLQQHQVGHGCISTVDIGISDNGSIKLIDPSLASNSPFEITYGYYYSPQLMKLNTVNINSSNSLRNPEVDFFKNDVFVLGMVILQMGLLSEMSHCYNYNTGTLSMNKIRGNVIEFQEIYGPQLAHLLNQMISLDQEERISPDGILTYLQEQYDDSADQSGDEIQDKCPNQTFVINHRHQLQSQRKQYHQQTESIYQEQIACLEQQTYFPKASMENNLASFNKENLFIENPHSVKPRTNHRIIH